MNDMNLQQILDGVESLIREREKHEAIRHVVILLNRELPEPRPDSDDGLADVIPIRPRGSADGAA